MASQASHLSRRRIVEMDGPRLVAQPTNEEVYIRIGCHAMVVSPELAEEMAAAVVDAALDARAFRQRLNEVADDG